MHTGEALLIVSVGLTSFLASVYYVDRQIKKIMDEYTHNKMVDEILHTKILALERDVEKLEKFKMKIMERNVIVRENRAWDTSSSEDEYDEEDEVD